MAILVLLVAFVILALLGVAALRVGVDSREDATDTRAPRGPLGLQSR
jgi:Tfp pilus assembly protein PilX